jgi:tRNA pseudouridine55 synthase
MDGILIIDKPEGPTSHDVVNRLRRILKTKKIGHTGTLDPFATGVLVMLIGKATRLAQFLDKDDKEYEALIRFGFETDTGDRTGARTAECGLRNEALSSRLANLDWNEVLPKFRGEIIQIPPMYSAKKVNGKKLYQHARKGVMVERQPVTVLVRELEILDPGKIHDPQSAIRIRVVCSAGTYIRTLAEDIGRAIGVGAHLQDLRRTRAGGFRIENAATLEELEEAPDPFKFLRPMNEAVAYLPEFVLDNDRVEKTLNGLSTRVERDDLSNGAVRMVNKGGNVVAVGVYSDPERIVRPKIVLM